MQRVTMTVVAAGKKIAGCLGKKRDVDMGEAVLEKVQEEGRCE